MLIVANWKAYVEDSKKAKQLFAVSKRLARTGACDIVLAPPAPLLGAFAMNNKSAVAFCAQDISATTGGATTGEATAGAYVAAGASYTIVGHSERRALGDTDAIISEKLARAFAQGLTPILCIGERERDGEGRYLTYLREQLTAALTPLTMKERAKTIVAYEPIWAIGKTSEYASTPHDLNEMVLYIRKVLSELLSGKNASHSLVLYGGSVEPDGIRALAAGSSVDGFLVGHASIDPVMFAELVKQLS